MTAAGYLRHDAASFSMTPGPAALFEGGVLPFDPLVLCTFEDVLSRLTAEVEASLRDGSGVAYSRYQPEFSAAQDAMNGVLYDQFLVQDWVLSVTGLLERLTDGAGVADLGCGGGRALSLLAAAFPRSRFTGYDLDEAALHLGAAKAAEQGLTNLRFERRDVAELDLDGGLDVVRVVDAVHDQAAPSQVLASVARALRPDGVFVMVEPSVTGDLDVDVQHPDGGVRLRVQPGPLRPGQPGPSRARLGRPLADGPLGRLLVVAADRGGLVNADVGQLAEPAVELRQLPVALRAVHAR